MIYVSTSLTQTYSYVLQFQNAWGLPSSDSPLESPILKIKNTAQSKFIIIFIIKYLNYKFCFSQFCF